MITQTIDGRDEEITRQQLAAFHTFDPVTARPDQTP